MDEKFDITYQKLSDILEKELAEALAAEHPKCAVVRIDYWTDDDYNSYEVDYSRVDSQFHMIYNKLYNIGTIEIWKSWENNKIVRLHSCSSYLLRDRPCAIGLHRLNNVITINDLNAVYGKYGFAALKIIDHLNCKYSKGGK